MMADDRRSLRALLPVSARRVAARGRVESLWIRAGQDVVVVYRVTAAADELTLFGQCSVLVEVVGIRVH